MGRGLGLVLGQAIVATHPVHIALVLVVMTVQTEILPITAVLRVVVVVMILVVDGELAQIDAGKFPTAAGADPGVNTQRLLTIALLPLLGLLPGIGYDPV